MAGPVQTPVVNPNQARDEALARQLTRWNSVSGKLALGSLLDQLENLNGELDGLEPTLADLRARGYRYGRGWEEQAKTLQARWATQRLEARRTLDERVMNLRSTARQTEQAVQRAQREPAWVNTAERQLGLLEQQVSDAERDVRGAFDRTQGEVSALNREFKQVAAMLEALDSATFQLYPDENGVAACKAQWLDKGEEPEGILYLTDGRLILEQKEKKATKKVLFVTTAKELVQKLLFETPVGSVAQVEAADKGGVLGIGSKELLTLRFSAAPQNTSGSVTLQLKDGAQNEAWSTLIRRVQTGQIQSERYDAPAPAESGASAATSPATAAPPPTQCPACGAKLPPVTRGMRQIVCEYCGTAVPIP